MDMDRTLTVYMPEAAFIYLPLYLVASIKLLKQCGYNLILKKAELPESGTKKDICDDVVLKLLNGHPETEGFAVGIADPTRINQVEGDFKVIAPLLTGTKIWSIRYNDKNINYNNCCDEILGTVKAVVEKNYDGKCAGASGIYGTEDDYVLKNKDKKCFTTNMCSLRKAKSASTKFLVDPVNIIDNIIMTGLICNTRDLKNEEKNKVIKCLVKSMLIVKPMLSYPDVVSKSIFMYLLNNDNKSIRGDLLEATKYSLFEKEFKEKLSLLGQNNELQSIFPKDLNISKKLWKNTCYILEGSGLPYKKFIDNNIVYEAESEISKEYGINIRSVLYCNKFWRSFLKCTDWIYNKMPKILLWLIVSLLFIIFALYKFYNGEYGEKLLTNWSFFKKYMMWCTHPLIGYGAFLIGAISTVFQILGINPLNFEKRKE